MNPHPPILEVRNLRVGFETEKGLLVAVDGVDFSVPRGQTLGLVGESGCGKSVTAMSLMRLLPRPSGKLLDGQILFDGRDLARISDREMRSVRGREIAMIFQEPMAALNPVQRIGRQIGEVFLLHCPEMSDQEITASTIELLTKVGIPAPEVRINEYPHQLSGGMRQRVVIAMALALRPRLIIADEPTTALDVTIQAQILELMKSLQQEMGTSIIIITHDLGVIAETCDEVAVMYAGRIAERGPLEAIFNRPLHLYTHGLLQSIPRLEHPSKTPLPTIGGMVPGLDELPVGARFAPRSPSPLAPAYLQSNAFANQRPSLIEHPSGHWVENEPAVLVSSLPASDPPAPSSIQSRPDLPPPKSSTDPAPLLEIKDLRVHFPLRKGLSLRTRQWCKAVDSVNLSLHPGETLGLVGESGCGKTTLGKAILRLNQPTTGAIQFEGQDLLPLSNRALRPFRRQIQMVFQDPADSLNARQTIGNILEEPLIIHQLGDARERAARVSQLLEIVGLRPSARDRFPFEFSGGQRQRIGIARAIALNPKLIVCDEPVSALDVSVQGQILNLLLDLQREFQLTYLFIAHDLAVVKQISDRIAIMYLGKIVELAPAQEIFNRPLHAYTKALLSAIPEPSTTRRKDRLVLRGDLPSPIDPPPGCAFARRSWMDCPPDWLEREGTFKEVFPGHWVEVHPATVENYQQYLEKP
ncbi:MAG: dipeptide ABC transporter ATP-binding protein [Puniceicoccaceae bacterium]